ncbi:MAG: slipin family protein [Planctomycetota bacterium]|jgi:regulator of protease activity HflC (stomatin/prohibitin superfamily)
MFMFKRVKVRRFEKGLLFRDNEFQGVLDTGRYLFFDPLGKVRVDVVSTRLAWFTHPELDVIVRSGSLKDVAEVLDLSDSERALVWVDGRFETVLEPGLWAYWTTFRKVRIEVVDAGKVRFEHAEFATILKAESAGRALNQFVVEGGNVGLYFLDGRFVSRLEPGTYAFWKNVGKVKLYNIDTRVRMIDVAGQEIMTADKVSLRMNAVVTYRIADPERSVTEVEDAQQSLYREAQLALRAVIGTRELDKLLTEKDTVAKELEEIVRARTSEFGLKVVSLGIRDVILPGEMKDLMNRVTEAKKAAEAALITRREETAAMRSQANTAKILEASPTLMRLRELEVIEKLTGKADLSVILGEKGLAEKVTKLI